MGQGPKQWTLLPNRPAEKNIGAGDGGNGSDGGGGYESRDGADGHGKGDGIGVNYVVILK
ncbi:hypothetical protein GBA52_000279 [Prunus armeniaca]|nr:hypothetical protein GBA52_000279 [Prunus armeniaca]